MTIMFRRVRSLRSLSHFAVEPEYDKEMCVMLYMYLDMRIDIDTEIDISIGVDRYIYIVSI